MRLDATSIFPSGHTLDLAPPRWALELFGDSSTDTQLADGIGLTIRRNHSLSLISARLPDAIALPADAFERRTTQIYRAIHRALGHCAAIEPVRFWNFIPAIHQPMGAELDRYMIFNAGRFKALCDWFGGSDRLSGQVPTASGVGHSGDDLVIHCLAARQRGRAVENPRQIPAFRYSKRYGPLPPCFARATLARDVLPSGVALFIGGTASICGEQSVHSANLTRQIRETLTNIASLIAAADASVPESAALKAMTDVRVYFPRLADERVIAADVRAALTTGTDVQFVQANLCRTDLLVEIEGVARL